MKNKKRALITGINGQDGSYLAEYLLSKDYEVFGTLKRNSVVENQTSRLNNIFENVNLEYADLTDMSSLTRLIKQVKPAEIYNLGAQSHVKISFDQPIYTTNTIVFGTLNLLESIRLFDTNIRLYQASSSEMFGNSIDSDGFQRESTPMHPVSPYGCAKLFGYNIIRNYRHSYKLFLSNGILFNHESPRRGLNFVTNKVVNEAVKIKLNLSNVLELGNLQATRDWGHAKDYVEMQWLMLQQEKPSDYVIATGRQVSVRDFVELSAKKLGWDNGNGQAIYWEGDGLNEIGYRKDTNKPVVRIDPTYFRASEVNTLLGDPSKAKKDLGWEPKISLESLVEEMIDNDLKEAKKRLFIESQKF